MSDTTATKAGGPLVLLLPCIECGDALEIQGDCMGLSVRPDELDRHGWFLSAMTPPSASAVKVAPVCGRCAEIIYGDKLETLREAARATRRANLS